MQKTLDQEKTCKSRNSLPLLLTVFVLVFQPAGAFARETALPSSEFSSHMKTLDEILQAAPPRQSKFQPKDLPPEPAQDHELNRVLDLGPLQQSKLIPLSALTGPIRLEASFNEPIGLEEALKHGLKYNFAIGLAKESWVYQKWGLYGRIMSYIPIPSSSLSWNLNNSHVAPDQTASNSRFFTAGQGYPLFAGGSAFYSMLSQIYRERGWGQAYLQSINDSLLAIYTAYNALRLNNALMQIKAKSLEVSQAQLKVNNALYVARAGTKFAVMQSRSQLALDQQELLKQQVATRLAAISLSTALNVGLSANLIPKDVALMEDDIIDENISIEKLFDIALKKRPDLREYELYQVASGRDVQATASSLYPNASASTGYTFASTTTYASTASVNNNLLQQAIAFNQQKLANQSGSQSGGTSGGSSSTSTSSSVASSNANAGIFGGLTNTVQAGFGLNWSLPNLGMTTVCNIVSARALSRQAMMQANQALLLAEQQVRDSYLNAITSRTQIDSTAYGVESSKEALRLAMLRLRTGVGTNLEVIQAQRDFITALIAQATAISDSNQAQAQLQHDMGIISVDNLVRGFFPDRPFKGPRLRK